MKRLNLTHMLYSGGALHDGRVSYETEVVKKVNTSIIDDGIRSINIPTRRMLVRNLFVPITNCVEKWLYKNTYEEIE